VVVSSVIIIEEIVGRSKSFSHLLTTCCRSFLHGITTSISVSISIVGRLQSLVARELVYCATRIILLALFVITAAAVSSITYVLLQQEEYVTFQASVRTLETRDKTCESIFQIKLLTTSQHPFGRFTFLSFKNSQQVSDTQP
jgi:hypothetical protein